MTMRHEPIPVEILAPLARSRWMTDDYNLEQFEDALEVHADSDRRDGCTCQYVFNPGIDSHPITRAEFLAMSEHIPDAFRTDASLNQHYMHSLIQFYAHVQQQWDAHMERTDELLGTPAGRIRRSDGLQADAS